MKFFNGKNLLTLIYPWRGMNYQDSLVISETASKKMAHIETRKEVIVLNKNEYFVSLDDSKYIPLPEIGTEIKKGYPFAKIKRNYYGKDIHKNFSEPKTYTAKFTSKVKEVRVFAKEWNHQIKEHDLFIQSHIRAQKLAKKKIMKMDIPISKRKLICYELGCTGVLKELKYNGDVDMIIEVIFENEIPMKVGDKVGNRHGNKGIISTILPDTMMPKLSDGRICDIVLNPLSLISRMNAAGEIFEMAYCEAALKIREAAEKLKLDDLLELVVNSIKIIDMTPNQQYLRQTLEQLNNKPESEVRKLLESFVFYAPPFYTPKINKIMELCEYLGVQYAQETFDPGQNDIIKDIYGNPVLIGCGNLYWYKLDHLIMDKLRTRAIGAYSKKYRQPIKTDTVNNGQKFGHMEMEALLASNAKENIREIMYEKSDDFESKDELVENQIFGIDEEPKNRNSSINEIFESYLNVLGLEITEDEDYE